MKRKQRKNRITEKVQGVEVDMTDFYVDENAKKEQLIGFPVLRPHYEKCFQLTMYMRGFSVVFTPTEEMAKYIAQAKHDGYNIREIEVKIGEYDERDHHTDKHHGEFDGGVEHRSDALAALLLHVCRGEDMPNRHYKRYAYAVLALALAIVDEQSGASIRKALKRYDRLELLAASAKRPDKRLRQVEL